MRSTFHVRITCGCRGLSIVHPMLCHSSSVVLKVIQRSERETKCFQDAQYREGLLPELTMGESRYRTPPHWSDRSDKSSFSKSIDGAVTTCPTGIGNGLQTGGVL